MQKITVKSIKHDDGENKPFIITTADGAKMSGFSSMFLADSLDRSISDALAYPYRHQQKYLIQIP